MPLSVLVQHHALIIRSFGACLQMLTEAQAEPLDLVGCVPLTPGPALGL